jgi:hypothetical protein
MGVGNLWVLAQSGLHEEYFALDMAVFSTTGSCCSVRSGGSGGNVVKEQELVDVFGKGVIEAIGPK